MQEFQSSVPFNSRGITEKSKTFYLNPSNKLACNQLTIPLALQLLNKYFI